MTNYQELKRLAEAAKLELADIANVVIEDGDLSHHELFQSLASPDVVLGLIKSLEHTTMAAEAEAKEVDERNAVIAVLSTQNRALRDDKKVLLNHMDTFMRVSNDPAIYNLAKVVIERFAQAEGGV